MRFYDVANRYKTFTHGVEIGEKLNYLGMVDINLISPSDVY